MRTGTPRTKDDYPPKFTYEVETDEDDIGLLHASLAGDDFCGVVSFGGQTFLNYSAPLSRAKETAARKKAKDHKAKRLAELVP